MPLSVLVTVLSLGPSMTSQQMKPFTFVTATDHFEFHSDPWINLHHFLYQWGREDRGLVTGRPPIPERASLGKLSQEERDIWLKAAAFYRDSVAARFHLDLEMLRFKRTLMLLNGDTAARPPDGIKGIAEILGSVMPIYRKMWWPEHDRQNRDWITNLMPLLRRHQAAYVQMTSRLYGAKWADSPYRVDVSTYFNSRAGYTAREGVIVMYSADPGSQGLYALEMLFHEVQHVEGISSLALDSKVLTPAFEAVGAELPINLTHALVFATAGEFARSVARSDRLPEHVPYWIREGFESQDEWKRLVPVVQKYWLPVVRGETSRTDGIAALARALRQ
jgi:hypothetical protein